MFVVDVISCYLLNSPTRALQIISRRVRAIFVTSLTSLRNEKVREFDRILQNFVTSAGFSGISSLPLHTAKARHLEENNHMTMAIHVERVRSVNQRNAAHSVKLEQ
jgi:hypothetical protein